MAMLPKVVALSALPFLWSLSRVQECQQWIQSWLLVKLGGPNSEIILTISRPYDLEKFDHAGGAFSLAWCSDAEAVRVESAPGVRL